MTPFFSLIIPVYNTPEDKMRRCINSLISQTFSDFEVLLIDDGSKEDCAKMLDLLSNEDNRINVIHKKNEGSSIARNTGIDKARGKYTSFIDSDDFIMPYVLDDAKKAIEKYNSDIIIGLAQKHYENIENLDNVNSNNQEIDPEKDIIEHYDVVAFINHILGYISSDFVFFNGYIGDGPWARFCKTEIVKNTFFDTKGFCSDDTIWNLELLPKCKNIAVVNRLWYLYMINNNSKTRRLRNDALAEVQFRIQQEYNLAVNYNQECKKGVFIKIWRETDTLGRSYLFNKKNKIKFGKKIRVFKEFIQSSVYQEMLNGISFDSEPNFTKRSLKKMCRFCLLHKIIIIPYFIWFILVRKSV